MSSTGTMSISVLLTGPSAGTVTMDYATAAGSATAGSDYTTTTGSLTFTSGQTSKNVSVPITSDAIDEDDETFTLSVANVAGAGVTAGTGIGTIVDDDAEPDLSIANASVTEGNSGAATASFAVTLSAASGREITVDYTTADGTAVAGSDYTTTSGTLTFAAGETSTSVDVPVTGDTLYEGNQTFAVSLSSPSNAGIADADAVGTITDDDPKPSFSIDDVSVVEGNAGTATATFTVSMSNPSAAGASVQWATSDGSALAGSDYEAGGATLTFSAGDVSQTVHVTIDGDTVDESDETFGVTLSTPTGATIADASATGTITDDDKTPTALTLKAKKTTKAVKAVGVIEAAATGMKVKVTLFKKQGGKYVKVLAKTVTVTKLGDRDADGIADAAYAAAFKRPKKGAYRFVAKYARICPVPGLREEAQRQDLVVVDRLAAGRDVGRERLHEPGAVLAPPLLLVEVERRLPPGGRHQGHPEAPALAREILGGPEQRRADAQPARTLGDDHVVHARLRSVVPQPLVVLHVDDADDLVAGSRDEGHVPDPAQVPGERLAMGRVVGRPLRDPAAQLHEQRGDRGPVFGPSEPDVDVVVRPSEEERRPGIGAVEDRGERVDRGVVGVEVAEADGVVRPEVPAEHRGEVPIVSGRRSWPSTRSTEARPPETVTRHAPALSGYIGSSTAKVASASIAG